MLKFSMSYKGALVQWENISLAAKGSGVRIPYAPYVKAAEMSFFILVESFTQHQVHFSNIKNDKKPLLRVIFSNKGFT